MPELPDIELYLSRIRERVLGRRLSILRLISPFVLRSTDPGIDSLEGRQVLAMHRLGKRVVFAFEGQLFVVVHLMIAGRFRRLTADAKPPERISLAVFEFETGNLVLTESGRQKRASIHVVAGEDELALHNPGGLEVLESSLEDFRARLHSANHTLKRALTKPSLFSGIGNAYSDEILHAARLSPVKLTLKLNDNEIVRLYDGVRATVRYWIDRLEAEYAGRFPGAGDITAFRQDFSVHGKFGQPCRVCRAPIQRIRYATNETNYCANCQNDGRILADRSLSRLLKEDWPRSIDEL
jgi:formamidopyrimidine-DNA glycosylase